jgi:hypothetical protein
MKAKLMMCLMALSVAFTGYISCFIASHVHWNYIWISAPALLPGLSFGLVTAGWLLQRRWVGRGRAISLVVGSTVAYFAAYWSAFYIVVLSGKGMVFSQSRLPLFHAGMIAGVVGTALLTASLAAVSADFRRKGWKTLIIIGTAAGGALCLAGVGAKSGDYAGTLGNPGDRAFISLWQLLVGGYIGVLLFGAPSFSSGPSERGRIAQWATRAVLILLLASLIHAAIGFSRGHKESTAASPATSGEPNAQLNTPADADATAWANNYRNAKFITRAEFLKRVGPVHLVIRERSGVSECVRNLDDIVRTSASAHGWTLASSPTDVEMVVDADIERAKITTTESTSSGPVEQEGYQMAYTALVQVGLVTKANCRRGDKFVQLDVYPYRNWGAHYGCIGDWVDFDAAYAKAFRQAIDDVFDAIGKMSDADDTDDEAAWTNSLWPPAQNAEMQKKFLSPMKVEPGASNPVFYGVTKFELADIGLIQDAGKELNARSLQQSWISELSRNGHEIDPSSDVRIRHEVGAFNLSRGWLWGSPICYVNVSAIRVWQNNVVFEFNGELRRARVCIWSDLDSATALPRDQSNTARDVVNRSIRSAAKEFASRR